MSKKNKDNKYDELLKALFIFLKENNAPASANNQITKLEAKWCSYFHTWVRCTPGLGITLIKNHISDPSPNKGMHFLEDFF